MKRWNVFVVLVPILTVAIAGLTGCYTQIGTVRDDRDRQEEYAYEEEQSPDSVTQEDYETARNQFYYDSYYPSVGLGFGYYDPWYGYYPSYGYYPGYYGAYYCDPFYGWCGTSYPYYYAGWGYWGYPSYGWYTPGFYRYRVGDNVTVRPGGAYGATRTFGATRTGGSTRTVGQPLPTGRSYQPGSGTVSPQPASVPRVSTGRREGARPAQVGGSTTRGGNAGRSGNSGTVRSGNTRSAPASSGRSGVRRYQPSNSPPPASAPRSAPGNSGGSSGRSGGGQSYSPPSPPPSSGSQAPSNTGRRGTERRN